MSYNVIASLLADLTHMGTATIYFYQKEFKAVKRSCDAKSIAGRALDKGNIKGERTVASVREAVLLNLLS